MPDGERGRGEGEKAKRTESAIIATRAKPDHQIDGGLIGSQRSGISKSLVPFRLIVATAKKGVVVDGGATTFYLASGFS